mmetsp:Transcript_73246/g.136886  ORF Transcript_73246/g.136886 Transcript_73246/m.136886 type:complete len:291 (+) Transcript_73246:145-1017(+)
MSRLAALLCVMLFAAATADVTYMAITPDDSPYRCDGTGSYWGEGGRKISGIKSSGKCWPECTEEEMCVYVHWDDSIDECRLYETCSAVRPCPQEGKSCGKTMKKQSTELVWQQVAVQPKARGPERLVSAAQVRLSEILDSLSDEAHHIARRVAADKASLRGSEKGVQQAVDNANSVQSAVLANNASLVEINQQYAALEQRAGAAVQLVKALSSRQNDVNRTAETVSDVLNRINTAERTLNLMRPPIERMGHNLLGLEGSLRHPSLRGVIAEETDSMMLRLYKDLTFALSE